MSSLSNDFVRTHKAPEDVICLCGDTECHLLTAGFADLRDARKRFVRLPPYENVDSPFYQERNRRRKAYLRHILPNHDSTQETLSEFIALHHFHPTIITENARKIPKSLSLGQAVQLKMILSEKDKVVDENGGLPYFIFVPNYAKNQVKKDLETLTQEAQLQDWSDKESEASTIEIPEHISFDDESDESDVSSIGMVLDEKSDVITLKPLGPAAKWCRVIASGTFGAEKEKSAETETSAAVVSLEETVDTTREAEKEDLIKVEDSAVAVIESAHVDSTDNGAKKSLNKTTYYSIQELISGVKGVEYTKREQYLSPDDFEKVFDGMSKEEFNRLRKWKQQAMKKKVGLF